MIISKVKFNVLLTRWCAAATPMWMWPRTVAAKFGDGWEKTFNSFPENRLSFFKKWIQFRKHRPNKRRQMIFFIRSTPLICLTLFQCVESSKREKKKKKRGHGMSWQQISSREAQHSGCVCTCHGVEWWGPHPPPVITTVRFFIFQGPLESLAFFLFFLNKGKEKWRNSNGPFNERPKTSSRHCHPLYSSVSRSPLSRTRGGAILAGPHTLFFDLCCE